MLNRTSDALDAAIARIKALPNGYSKTINGFVSNHNWRFQTDKETRTLSKNNLKVVEAFANKVFSVEQFEALTSMGVTEELIRDSWNTIANLKSPPEQYKEAVKDLNDVSKAIDEVNKLILRKPKKNC